jgi:hypothetical protein
LTHHLFFAFRNFHPSNNFSPTQKWWAQPTLPFAIPDQKDRPTTIRHSRKEKRSRRVQKAWMSLDIILE